MRQRNYRHSWRNRFNHKQEWTEFVFIIGWLLSLKWRLAGSSRPLMKSMIPGPFPTTLSPASPVRDRTHGHSPCSCFRFGKLRSSGEIEGSSRSKENTSRQPSGPRVTRTKSRPWGWGEGPGRNHNKREELKQMPFQSSHQKSNEPRSVDAMVLYWLNGSSSWCLAQSQISLFHTRPREALLSLPPLMFFFDCLFFFIIDPKGTDIRFHPPLIYKTYRGF